MDLKFDVRNVIRALDPRKVDGATLDIFIDLAREASERVSTLALELSGGRVGKETTPTSQVVWVTTRRGRRGAWRTTPLLSVREGETEDAPFIVNGSQTGANPLPRWVGNVRSNPLGFMQIGDDHYRVEFTEIVGKERDHLFAQMVSVWPPYQTFQRLSSELIPVFRVEVLGQVESADVPQSA